jgi:hypothetical protein
MAFQEIKPQLHFTGYKLMPEDFQKVTFAQILKSPPVYMLMVAVSILWVFVYQFIGTSDQVAKNCESEKIELRKELTQARADKDALTTALLIKNGIIFKQEQDKKELDSALRDGPGKKAKRIVTEH